MIFQPDIPVILASASPRRKELLEKLGLRFSVIPAHIDETMLKDEDPINYASRMSLEKGEAIAKKYPERIVISSDTVVVHKEHILGKPSDPKDARRMLKMLSGKTHQVITAFTILQNNRDIERTEHEISDVTFRDLNDSEIDNYIATGSPLDKAGAYGIQDLHANLVKSINGCFYNVIGFPVARFKKIWDELFS